MRKVAGSIAGGDGGPEHAERVEALGAHPLVEARVLLEEVDRGDVVDAGVAEDVARRFRLAHVGAAPADDDAELALVDDLAGIGFRPPDRLAVRVVGVGRLDEIERLLRLLKVVLGGELVEIVPKADHLARAAGRQDAHGAERDALARRLRRREHVSSVHGDDAVRERAESDLVASREPQPMSHPLLPDADL